MTRETQPFSGGAWLRLGQTGRSGTVLDTRGRPTGGFVLGIHAATTGQLQLPVGMSYVRDDPQLARFANWSAAGTRGAIVHAWHSQSWVRCPFLTQLPALWACIRIIIDYTHECSDSDSLHRQCTCSTSPATIQWMARWWAAFVFVLAASADWNSPVPLCLRRD